MAKIHRRGQEIGHHGYLHEALEGKSREEEEAIPTDSSKILAAITGMRPVGYRAPLYEITHEMAGLLAKAMRALAALRLAGDTRHDEIAGEAHA